MHWAGDCLCGGYLLGGRCLPRGVSEQGVSAQEPCVSQHALGRGVSTRGCLLGGGCLPRRGVYPSMHWAGDVCLDGVPL